MGVLLVRPSVYGHWAWFSFRNIIYIGHKGCVFKMILVKRDFRLLNDMYFVKYLNTKRIVKLFGCHYRYVMTRLNQLENQGYIQRIDFMINREIIWCLKKNGFNLINQIPYYTSKQDKIYHHLACADFYFYLRQQHYNIQYFALDEEISFRYQGKKHKFRPDILLKVDQWYLVEIDLSNKRFEEKIKKWESYYYSGMYTARFDVFPTIYTVSNDVSKVRTIIDRCKTLAFNYAYKDYADVANNQYKY